MKGVCCAAAITRLLVVALTTAATPPGSTESTPLSPGAETIWQVKRATNGTPVPTAGILDIVPDVWWAPRSDPALALAVRSTSCHSIKGAFADVRAIVRRTYLSYADSAQWSRGTLVWRNSARELRASTDFWMRGTHAVRGRVPALYMRLVSATRIPPGDDSLKAAFERAGWQPDELGGEGPLTEFFIYTCREAECILLSTSNGIGPDDVDSTYVENPGFAIELLCIPRGAPTRRE